MESKVRNMPLKAARRPSPEGTVADTMAVLAELAQSSRRAAPPAASAAAGGGRPAVSESMRSAAVAGWAIIIIFFGGFGGWAMTAPLHGAIVAQAFVKVEGNRKSVQHLDGGIVKELRVKEGDRVNAGDVLIVLDDTQARAEYNVLWQQFLVLRATEERLKTELAGGSALVVPADIKATGSDDPTVAGVWQSQIHQFESRRAALAGQRNVIKEKIAQLESQITGGEAQVKAFRAQFESVQKELESIQPLVEQGLIAPPTLPAARAIRRRAGGPGGRDHGQYRQVAAGDRRAGCSRWRSSTTTA